MIIIIKTGDLIASKAPPSQNNKYKYVKSQGQFQIKLCSTVTVNLYLCKIFEHEQTSLIDVNILVKQLIT